MIGAGTLPGPQPLYLRIFGQGPKPLVLNPRKFQRPSLFIQATRLLVATWLEFVIADHLLMLHMH